MLLLLAKATLVLVAALALSRGLHRAAAGTRYLVWLATVAGLLLVPALAVWSPVHLGIFPPLATAPGVAPARPAITIPATSVVDDAGALDAITGARATNTAAGIAAPAGGGAPVVHDVAGLVERVVGHVVPALVALWLLVALSITGSLLRAWLAVRRIVRRARPLDAAAWRDPLWEIADRLGLEEPPRLLGSDDTRMPFACGLARPTIVLPAESETWTLDRRRAVLLHELAHVRRHDLVGHTLARVVCALYWFHPLVWTAARRLRAESERACDDLALTCGARAADYAEHLLDIVTAVRRDATPLVALAMARRTEFEGRMLDILDGERRRATPGRWQSAALVGALVLLTVAVGAVTPAPALVPPALPIADAGIASRERAAASVPAPVAAVASPRPAAPPPVVDSDRQAIVSTRVDARIDSVAVAVTPRVTIASPVSVDGDAVQALRQTATLGGGVSSSDDRAALLARVLRSDTSAALRRVAAWGLREYAEEPVGATALTAALRGDRAATVREMAAWSLAEGDRTPAAGDALAVALRSDADASVRTTAAWALGTVGDQRATDALVGALGDATAEVRARAVWAIGTLGPREAPRALVAMLADRDPSVRELTAWALFTIHDPAALPALQRALRAEREPEIQVADVRALAAMGERSVDVLRDLLDASDPRVRNIAIRALAGGGATGPWPHPWPQPRPFP